MALFSNPVKDYSEIIQLLNTKSDKKDDLYNALMDKETNVLNTINRVANTKQNLEFQSTLLYNQTILGLIALFGNTWKNIFQELVIEKRFRDALAILTDGDRKIHLGFMLALIALFIYLVDITA